MSPQIPQACYKRKPTLRAFAHKSKLKSAIFYCSKTTQNEKDYTQSLATWGTLIDASSDRQIEGNIRSCATKILRNLYKCKVGSR